MIGESKQALVAFSETGDDVKGKICLYSRNQGAWKQDCEPFNGVFGRNGLIQEELKREGDGKSPAGIYRIGPVYGQLAAPPSQIRMEYRQITQGIEAVDDPKSLYYNQIMDRKDVERPDWNSSEKMSEIDVYDLAVVVQYNWPNVMPYRGSAIFLHRWRAEGEGTGGCTAMDAKDLLRVIQWLDPRKNPVIVQGSKSFVERVLA